MPLSSTPQSLAGIVTRSSPRSTDTTVGAVKLFEHQCALLHAMRKVESVGLANPGVLGDPPGTGKSYPALALAFHDDDPNATTIVAVPLTLVSQWKAYAEAARPPGKALLTATDPVRDLRASGGDLSRVGGVILLDSGSGLSSVKPWLRTHPVARLIIDEADLTPEGAGDISEMCRAMWLITATAAGVSREGFANTLLTDAAFVVESSGIPPAHFEVVECAKAIDASAPLGIHARCLREAAAGAAPAPAPSAAAAAPAPAAAGKAAPASAGGRSWRRYR